MKALFIGIGSIGKRHIRDFYNECRKHGVIPEIHALRRKTGGLGSEEDALIRKQITEITDSDYDVTFITNPTNLHYDAINKCRKRTKWYFIEKPIFDDPDLLIEDLDINSKNTYVAAPMRHTALYKELKKVVNDNPVFSVRVICSSYLPDWRKGVDYRTVYSAKREMGGGVNIDLIHEIDYIYDLLGEPKNVLGTSGKFSGLEITSNDLATFIFEYDDKLCEIHLDYFGRENRRTCEVFTENGTYIADFFGETLRCPDGSMIDCHKIPDEEFLNEMDYFYRFINGEAESMNPPDLALKTLRIALKGDKCNVL